MKKEIKFRGKRIDNGEWVYGYFVKDPKGGHRIYWQPFDEASNNTYHFVEPETVGEYTGLKDKNGVDIYEGDIVTFTNREKRTVKGFVKFDSCSFYISSEFNWYAWIDYYNFKVIGNIHENKELSK